MNRLFSLGLIIGILSGFGIGYESGKAKAWQESFKVIQSVANLKARK